MTLGTFTPLQKIEAYALMLEKTGGMEDLCVVSGRRAYFVGDQHGGFPPIGFHLPGEMGGIWMHAAKMLDGFWLRIHGGGSGVRLDKASRFVVGPGFCEHIYELPQLGLTVTRREWVPDEQAAVVVEISFKNERDVPLSLEIDLSVQVNLRPAWRAEELQIRDGQDEALYLEDLHAIVTEDTLNGWSVVVGTDWEPTHHEIGATIEGRQLAGASQEGGLLFRYDRTLEPKGWTSMRMLIAGSLASGQAARDLYEDLQAHHSLYFDERVARLESLANRTRLGMDDAVLNQAFLWAKLNYAALEVDTAVGRGIVGGYPEAPWFSSLDICLSAEALVACGCTDVLKDSLDVLLRYADAWLGGEEVPNVVTAQGAPYHRPNQLALPLFVSALDTYMRWTGDRTFVQRCMPLALKLMARLQTERKGLNLVPRGVGLIDKPGYGQRNIETACILYEALLALESLCTSCGEGASAQWARRRAEDLGVVIASSFWLPKAGQFADMCAPQQSLNQLMESILRRLKGMTMEQLKEHLPTELLVLGAEEAVPEGVMWGWAGRHWTSIYPFVVGAALYQQIESALPRYEGGQFMSAWGLMTQGAADKKVTALGTGLLATAFARNRRVDQGVQTAKRMALSLLQEMPGMFSELLPDQGSLVRAAAVSSFVPFFVQTLLGIRPNLMARSLEVIPLVGEQQGVVRLDDLRIGDLNLSVRAVRGERYAEVSVILPTHGLPTFLGAMVPHSVPTLVLYNGDQQRQWDTAERKVHGQRCVGMQVDLRPGINTVRVQW